MLSQILSKLLMTSAPVSINLLMTSCCPHTLPDSDTSVIGRGIKSGLERATEVRIARHRLRKARRRLTKTGPQGTAVNMCRRQQEVLRYRQYFYYQARIAITKVFQGLYKFIFNACHCLPNFGLSLVLNSKLFLTFARKCL
jgi:hypothetical protein